MTCDNGLIVTDNTSVVSVTSPEPEIVVTEQVFEIVTDNEDVVLQVEERFQVIEVSGSGPKGDTGAQGESRKQYVASTNISGHVAVALNSLGQLIVADCTQAQHALSVLGVTTDAVTTLNTTLVTTSGSVEHLGWTFLQGYPVYLGENGQLTQTLPPTRQFTKILGIAVSPTIINLQPQPAIFKPA